MTNNTTAPALTDEQRKAIETAIAWMPYGSDASDTLRALLTSPRAAGLPAPDLYWFGDHEHGFECPDDAAIVHGRKLGERFTLKASWYADMLFEVTKVPDDNDDDYEVRAVDAAPAATVAEYDGNHVQNHCTECNEHEAECSCAQAVAADGAPIDTKAIAESLERMIVGWYADCERTRLDWKQMAGVIKLRLDRFLKRAAVSPATADRIPDECVASGSSCSYAPNGRHGEMQCRYCGKEKTATADERAALREMLDDARNEFTMVREALGVAYEPHQTLLERTLDAARASQAATPQANAAEESEDAYVIRRLSETLADVAVTLRGDDPVHPDDPLNKIELVKRLAEVLRMEVELYRAPAGTPGRVFKQPMNPDDEVPA
ncbi:hypothetical protein GAS19_07690 [Burkholderia glumae]|uniref:hypothetical protein n=1 Tax=Burkholderia glumae TaxID=337 RepID=UPI00129725AA|nr:hypothetical protein [Burkholderia glumae]QGA37540.1 hypothetical protein GAS19_07690 [Burkholderia glumae]